SARGCSLGQFGRGRLSGVETGKGADALDQRSQLAAALSAARSARCSVLVSKLDRLSRDVAFVSDLMAQWVPTSWLNSPGRSCSGEVFGSLGRSRHNLAKPTADSDHFEA